MRWAIELSTNALETVPDDKMPREEAASLIYALAELDADICEQVEEEQ